MSIFDKITIAEDLVLDINPHADTLRKSVFPMKPVSTEGMYQLKLVTDDDIDSIGESVSREIGQTTQNLINKMSVGRFDELGVILTGVALEVDKLDPSSIQKGGVVGWFQRKFGDLKMQLTVRLQSAQAVFDELEGQIGNHIAAQQDWVRDLESLYMENYDHYRKIIAEIDRTKLLIANAESQIANWPEIDLSNAEAGMQVQLKRDSESKVNRMRGKLDNLVRLKAMTEINSPKIRQQQETSRANISTLKDVISQTIPIVKMEFVMFLQTLDVQKSIQLTQEVRNLATKTLTTGANSAKVAAIESAKALATPVVSTETLQALRTRMLETVTELKQIETNAVVKQQEDAKLIADGQKSLLTALQHSGKI